MTSRTLTPLEVQWLLRFHYSADPYGDTTPEHAKSEAVELALQRFAVRGWLQPGITVQKLAQVHHAGVYLAEPALTPAGEALVHRICNTPLDNL